jgi:membrane-associated protease RseP (regulator of RpoE activity)
VTFTVERDGRRLDLRARLALGVRDQSSGEFLELLPPGSARPDPPRGAELVGFLGVGPRVRYERLGLGAAVVDSGARVWELTRLSVRGIGDVFGMVFGGELFEAVSGEGARRPDEGPLGLVGAGRIAGQSVAAGRYLDLIGLVVGFTIFVGLMNLLPLPPLDGGHLAVLAYEAVTKQQVDMRKLIPIAAAVISFFVVLFLAVLYLDLARPITSPF